MAQRTRKGRKRHRTYRPGATCQSADSTSQKVIEIYDELAGEYALHYESGNPDKLLWDEFLKHVKRGSKLLDLGCGTGSTAKYFFQKGMRVEGVDLSPRMIAVASGRFPEIVFRREDIRKLRYPPGRFDAVWAGYSLFHMPRNDFETVVAKTRRLLTVAGIFGLTMQEGNGDSEMPDPFVPGKAILVCRYSLEQLRAILRANHFRLLAHKRRSPASEVEYPFDKLLLIAEAIANPAESHR
jgi:ubiquinone/menaquinone biosynthesis C-methylase UbiE